jgi:hypothetical protein
MPLFGDPPIEPADLAKLLISGPDLSWNSLKNTLYKRGNEDYKYVVACSLKEHDVQGWLLDLVWLDRDTLAMKLAVEDERSKRDKHIKDDFEKLMSVKAPLKLFIYNTGERVQVWLQDYLSKFPQHVEGERYLLMEINGGNANFYQYCVPADGKPVGGVEFTPLALERSSGAAS